MSPSTLDIPTSSFKPTDLSQSTNPAIQTTYSSTYDIPIYFSTLSQMHWLVCNSDRENCGRSSDQANYRGPINKTETGKDCVTWNKTDLNAWFMELEGDDIIGFITGYNGFKENFCRIPSDCDYANCQGLVLRCYTRAIVNDFWWGVGSRIL